MARWMPITLALLLTACAGPTPEATAKPSPTLRPRSTATATPSPPATPRASTPLATVGPSPTPLTHVIESGDTLLAIASTYGVDLADLLLANPNVNPHLLSVGAEIAIPSSGAQGPVPTPTPQPLTLSSPRCYNELNGGLWCLLLANSEQDQPVEAVVALVTLSDSRGTPLQTEPAYSPLNLLQPGSSMLLAAYFDQPASGFSSITATVASALAAGEVESRYPPVELELDGQQIRPDGLSASVAGTARLAGGEVLDGQTTAEPTLEYGLRVLAVALDASGQPVGYRVWETDRTDLLADGVGFELLIASLGPPIAAIQVQAEAR